MLPSLPTCIEDLNLDFPFEVVENGGDQQQQVEELFWGIDREEMQKILLAIDSANSAPDVQCLSVPPGFVLDNMKIEDIHQRPSTITTCSSVIPLSVQQEQLDSIMDARAISPSYWMIQDDNPTVSSAEDSLMAPTNAFQPQMPTKYQTSPEATDQTVPFRRRESVCSMLSSCGDVKEVKRERKCSVPESSETLTPSSSLLPTTLFTSPPTSQAFSYSGRRGRPCLDDLNGDAAKDVKKQRRRDQNRRAATKCRLKRRAEYEQLKKDHESVTRQNETLKAQLVEVVSQYERLQDQLTCHQHRCRLTLPSNIAL